MKRAGWAAAAASWARVVAARASWRPGAAVATAAGRSCRGREDYGIPCFANYSATACHTGTLTKGG
eukprot:scaffold9944_cov71-Phaeocystis_antarctica.AAC.2